MTTLLPEKALEIVRKRLEAAEGWPSEVYENRGRLAVWQAALQSPDGRVIANLLHSDPEELAVMITHKGRLVEFQQTGTVEFLARHDDDATRKQMISAAKGGVVESLMPYDENGQREYRLGGLVDMFDVSALTNEGVALDTSPGISGFRFRITLLMTAETLLGEDLDQRITAVIEPILMSGDMMVMRGNMIAADIDPILSGGEIEALIETQLAAGVEAVLGAGDADLLVMADTSGVISELLGTGDADVFVGVAGSGTIGAILGSGVLEQIGPGIGGAVLLDSLLGSGDVDALIGSSLSGMIDAVVGSGVASFGSGGSLSGQIDSILSSAEVDVIVEGQSTSGVDDVLGDGDAAASIEGQSSGVISALLGSGSAAALIAGAGTGLIGAILGSGDGAVGGGSVSTIEAAFTALAASSVSAVYDYGDPTGMIVERQGNGQYEATQVTDGDSVAFVMDRSFGGANTTGLTCAEFIAAQPNLIGSGGAFAWDDPANWDENGNTIDFVGGEIRITGVTGAATALQLRNAGLVTDGEWYYVEWKARNGSGSTAMRADLGEDNVSTGGLLNTERTFKGILQATTIDGYIRFQSVGAGEEAFARDFVFKHLPGYHAAAPTDAARPVYRSALGGYLDFDGVDDEITVALSGTADMNALSLFVTTDSRGVIFGDSVNSGTFLGYIQDNDNGGSIFGNSGSPTLELNGASSGTIRDTFHANAATADHNKVLFDGADLTAWSDFTIGNSASSSSQLAARRTLDVVYDGTGMSAADEAAIQAWVDEKNPLNAFTATQRGMAALANYTDPAFYDPSDLTSMFIDDTPATGEGSTNPSVGESVSIILDRSFGGENAAALTAEEYISQKVSGVSDDVLNFDASAWGTTNSFTFNGDGTATVASGSSGDQASISNVVTSGEFYLIEFTVSGLAPGAEIRGRFGAGSTNDIRANSDGTYRYVGQMDGTLIAFRTQTLTQDVTISGLKIKELPGHHMVAPSDAARATLQESGGLYWLEADGIDDWYAPASLYDLGSQYTHVGGWQVDLAYRRIFGTTDSGTHSIRDQNNIGYRINATLAADNGDTTIPHVLAVQYQSDAAAFVRINGLEGNYGTVDPSDMVGVQGLALFSQENDRWASGFDGRMYTSAFIPNANASGIDLRALELLAAEKSGATLA